MCVWYWLPASGYYGCSSPETASPVTQILASSQSPSLFTVSVNEFAHCLFTIGAHQLRRHDNSRSENLRVYPCLTWIILNVNSRKLSANWKKYFALIICLTSAEDYYPLNTRNTQKPFSMTHYSCAMPHRPPLSGPSCRTRWAIFWSVLRNVLTDIPKDAAIFGIEASGFWLI